MVPWWHWSLNMHGKVEMCGGKAVGRGGKVASSFCMGWIPPVLAYHPHPSAGLLNSSEERHQPGLAQAFIGIFRHNDEISLSVSISLSPLSLRFSNKINKSKKTNKWWFKSPVSSSSFLKVMQATLALWPLTPNPLFFPLYFACKV